MQFFVRSFFANVSDATVIIVAQRISTILHADQILVMDDGKIVGKGTHEELMKTCETYQQIASSQLSAKRAWKGGLVSMEDNKNIKMPLEKKNGTSGKRNGTC